LLRAVVPTLLVCQTGVTSPFRVRREKALVDRGCKSRPGTGLAPPGSNRSGGGGNETVGASGVEGHLGDLASMQAVTRVNAEQASKRLTQEPTRRDIGRAAADGTVRANEAHQTCRGNGDGKYAKLTSSNTGSPSGDRRAAINWYLVRGRPGRLG